MPCWENQAQALSPAGNARFAPPPEPVVSQNPEATVTWPVSRESDSSCSCSAPLGSRRKRKLQQNKNQGEAVNRPTQPSSSSLPDQQNSNTPAHLFHRRHSTYILKHSKRLLASIIEVTFPASSLQPRPKIQTLTPHSALFWEVSQVATESSHQGGLDSARPTRARPSTAERIYISYRSIRAICCLSIQQSHRIAKYIVLIAKISSMSCTANSCNTNASSYQKIQQGCKSPTEYR